MKDSLVKNLRLRPSILTLFVLLTVPAFLAIVGVTYISNEKIARANADQLVERFRTEAEAAALKKRIAAGEAFDVLARKYSTCPSGKKGGDLGEVRPGQMVRAIDQVIFKKPVREVHGPVKSQFGYHLVQVFYRE